MQVTLDLTRNMKEMKKMFQIAAFNVLAHNRDDHSKNFAFLMEDNGDWQVSPAYDLTFSYEPGGEHCTTLMGEGKTPSRSHLEKLADLFSISKADTQTILDRITIALSQWPSFAEEAGIRKSSMKIIQKQISP